MSYDVAERATNITREKIFLFQYLPSPKDDQICPQFKIFMSNN